MTINKLVKTLKEEGLSQVGIGKLIGRSILQVQMYEDGRTVTPGVKTALGIYRHITLDGVPLVIENFRGKQDIFDKVKDFEEQCNQVLRDEGYGHYDIVTKTSN